jgi:predicted nucleic acid-binding Zn ribbon protein
MRTLGGAVERLLRALGLEGELANAGAVDAWPAVARDVIGSDADGTRAIRVERDTLVVNVPDAQWASELRLRERVLVTRLRAAAPASGIRRIRPVPGGRATGGTRG